MASKEELQKKVNQERTQREKDMAQIKAQNELLEQAKENVKKYWGENTENANKVLKDIDTAKQQNLEIAETFLQASEKEIENSVYREPDANEVLRYDRYLAKHNKTLEEVARKDISGGIANVNVKKEESTIDKLKNKLSRIKKKKTQLLDEGYLNDEEFNQMVKEQRAKDLESFQNNQKESNHINIREVIEQERMLNDYIDKYENAEVNKTTDKVIELPKTEYKIEQQCKCPDFDIKSVPSEIAFDVINLPSKGECYPHKKSKLPVAYLTAADENLIASPNLYSSGSLIDLILERKILDKTIKVSELCQGDRDAIVVWLRATAYDTKFPVNATNPETGIVYPIEIDLSTLKYRPFDLVGDENGLFDYVTEKGDLIKFKMLTKEEYEGFVRKSFGKYKLINKSMIQYNLQEIQKIIDENHIHENEEISSEAINILNEWANTLSEEDNIELENTYIDSVTARMCLYTYSINGETNPNYIKSYIENMRTQEANKYRQFVETNQPGMDLKINVQIPESDGGGSFDTFLGIRDTIFLTV